MSHLFFAKTPHDLSDAVDCITSYLQDFTVVCLYAEMGSGKTTLIKSICEKLQVVSDTSSPTFSLVNEYQTIEERTIYHLDLYRLETIREALDAGVLQYIESGDVCFIEWPELIEPLIPPKHLKIYINLEEQNARKVEVVLQV